MVVLAAGEDREKIKVLESVEDVLPPELLPDFPLSTANDTDDILLTLYNSLAGAYNETPTEKGYTKFFEAFSEITQVHSEACSGPADSRVQPADIPGLVEEYVALKSSSDDLGDLREVFGKMLCIESQGARRRRSKAPSCPEPCTCPEGGLAGGDFWCSCQFFRCLDPEDDLQPLFGFEYDKLQSLGFVLDNTGSMGNELRAAKEVITHMITVEEDIEVLSYILTPYRDPSKYLSHAYIDCSYIQ